MPDPRNTATGYLVVAVSTARSAMPLENALVTVSAVDDNGVAELIYTTRTNRSGKTPPLPLPAPPLSNSLEPGSLYPYARYAVSVDLDGYQPIFTSDLTVFADVVATLPVYLVPLEENQPVPAEPQQRPLPEHSLNTAKE